MQECACVCVYNFKCEYGIKSYQIKEIISKFKIIYIKIREKVKCTCLCVYACVCVFLKWNPLKCK